MLTICEINSKTVTLSDDAGWRGTYSNTSYGRDTLKSILEKSESFDLWENEILSNWGEYPTIDDSSIQPTVAEIRQHKQALIKSWCKETIISGISIDLGLLDESRNPSGVLHYSLSEQHQADMKYLADRIANGATQVTWRDDSRVSHQIYTAEQFLELYHASLIHIYRCKYRSDGLEELLYSYSDDDIDLIKSLNWNTELPENIENRIMTLLGITIQNI